MLFPYIRRIVGDVTRDGGYPPLNLENDRFSQSLSPGNYAAPSRSDERERTSGLITPPDRAVSKIGHKFTMGCRFVIVD